MTIRGSGSKRVKRIFQQFDVNCDGVLKREEMVDLVVAVNLRGKVERVGRHKSMRRCSMSSSTGRRCSPTTTC